MDSLIDLCRKHLEQNSPAPKNEKIISMLLECQAFGDKKEVRDALQHFRITNALTATQKQFVKMALMELERECHG